MREPLVSVVIPTYNHVRFSSPEIEVELMFARISKAHLLNMDLRRISRIPNRVWQDLKIIRLVKNWREILIAKSARRPYLSIRFRNGLILNSPPEVMLDFLFHEIWIDEFYAPANYETTSGETVIDIGGNIDVFALWAATRAKGVKVYSYEPFPANAGYFEANVKASEIDNVKFYPVAVAGSEGKRILRVEDSWILHSLVEDGSDDVKGLEVNCTSLDNAMAEIEQCDFLKLDCEGGEYDILYSASPETLKKIKRVVCEFNVADSETKNGEGLRDFLSANGFAVETFKPLGEGCGMICARRYDH